MKRYITLICAVCFLLLYSCSEDTIDVVLTGTLTGKVTAKATGAPLKNVKITTKPAFTTVFTDSLGKFTIKNIPVEDYAVQAELEGYTTAFQAVSIYDNITSTVAIEMSIANTKNLAPSAPELVSPEDGAVEQPLEVTFIWDASDPDGDELTYTLDLRNGTTDERQSFEVVRDTFYTVSDLQLATRYFWQVTANDGTNDPVSSGISEFTTLTLPDNPFLFVKEKNGNLVIFSGAEEPFVNNQQQPDYNVLQLTLDNVSSFRPRKSNVLKRIAYLRNSGGNAQIYTMKFDGTDVRQVTTNRPVAGFRIDHLDFTWAQNDSKIYYPHFDKLYSVNYDGTGTQMIYQTTDGSFISEVAVPSFDNDLVLLKTNSSNGYNARVFTARLSTGMEETVIFENQPGAVGGIDITANADKVLYTWDKSGSENPVYQIFDSRIFIYTIPTSDLVELDTDVVAGENELDARFSPSEGGVIFTRVKSNFGAVPNIYSFTFDTSQDDQLLFTNAFMPDWE